MNEPGPQFKKLYRGQSPYKACDKEHKHDNACFANTSMNTTDLDNIGIHWTENKDVADEFAGPEGHVLTAYVHKRHIVDPSSKEGKRYAYFHRIWPQDKPYSEMHYNTKLQGKPESEVTLRKGSPVHIFSAEFNDHGNSRVENFKAPLGGLIRK